MTIDKKYVDQIINVTSKAAIASSFLVGRITVTVTGSESAITLPISEQY